MRREFRNTTTDKISPALSLSVSLSHSRETPSLIKTRARAYANVTFKIQQLVQNPAKERERERGSREGDVKDKGIVQDDSRAYTGIFEAYTTLYRVNFVLE